MVGAADSVAAEGIPGMAATVIAVRTTVSVQFAQHPVADTEADPSTALSPRIVRDAFAVVAPFDDACVLQRLGGLSPLV
jgi:hypothetical protein